MGRGALPPAACCIVVRYFTKEARAGHSEPRKFLSAGALSAAGALIRAGALSMAAGALSMAAGALRSAAGAP